MSDTSNFDVISISATHHKHGGSKHFKAIDPCNLAAEEDMLLCCQVVFANNTNIKKCSCFSQVKLQLFRSHFWAKGRTFGPHLDLLHLIKLQQIKKKWYRFYPHWRNPPAVDKHVWMSVINKLAESVNYAGLYHPEKSDYGVFYSPHVCNFQQLTRLLRF